MKFARSAGRARTIPAVKFPRTKIVCTVGSRDPSDPTIPQNASDFLQRLTDEGMSVVRLNLSHNLAWERAATGRDAGPSDGYEREDGWISAVDAVNRACGPGREHRRVAVLADLQGVKIRLALPPDQRRNGWDLEPGQRVRIGLGRGLEPPCVDGMPTLVGDVRRGLESAGEASLMMHLGDGETVLRVLGLGADDRLEAEVVVGGVLHDRKGVTFRGVNVTVDTVLTEKDRHDVAHFVFPRFLSGGVSVVALSFVRGPADVRALRAFVAGLAAAVRDEAPAADDEYAVAGAAALRAEPDLLARCRRLLRERAGDADGGRDLDIPIVAKLEMREAARGAAAILREADCVMVARGDLGLQCEPHEVPRLQKEILRAAARAGKPSIVATQMLGSMERFYEPRRPEASDVFNAVLDHTDAVMLSGETSTGIYPVRSVQVLRDIVVAAEEFGDPTLGAQGTDLARFYEGVREERAWRGDTAAVTDHACYVAALTARTLGCRGIVALTHTGGTARMVARFRPSVPVYAAVHDASVARRLALSYGVRPLEVPFLPAGTPVDEALGSVLAFLGERGHLAPGDRVVVLCGRPLGGPAGTNLVSVETVPGAK